MLSLGRILISVLIVANLFMYSLAGTLLGYIFFTSMVILNEIAITVINANMYECAKNKHAYLTDGALQSVCEVQ